jgi:hypothetical protein
MKKTAIALLVGALALGGVSAPSAAAPFLLVDYVGYDYESPNPDPTQFGEVGSGYVSLGECPVLYAPLVFNLAQNQYTYHISGLISVNRQVIAPFIIVDYSAGTLSVYEDDINTGTAFDYGTNPPNATAPPTFVDGTLFLTGPVTNFRFVFNTVDGSGSFDANFAVTGGSQLGNIPVSDRNGFTFAGATSNALNIPEGYAHQIDGQVFLEQVVPTQDSSWGRLKANYRR